YLSGGGFGPWERLDAPAGLTAAYLGLRSYPMIGLAWLMHAGWDVLHHFYGNAIWPFMPTSSLGCMIFDAVIALWFLAGAPALSSRGATAATSRALVGARRSAETTVSGRCARGRSS